ncbi:TPA: class I SAM-dependent methyltransferase family protein [Candidatus Bathyarchaeota archaeon]|nr:class I SAM-dependent methyltransferase family protein [Candidatus Bathyarchaeota archaeon]
MAAGRLRRFGGLLTSDSGAPGSTPANATRVLCLECPKSLAARVIPLCRGLGLLSPRFRIGRMGGNVLIPLTRRPDVRERKAVEGLTALRLTYAVLEKKRRRPEDLIEALGDELPPHLLACVPRSFDIVGDIAVMKIPEELEPHRFDIGRALLEVLSPGVRVVLRKASPVAGVYRTMGVEWLAGERRTETVHKEFGCAYRLDLAKVYFSPRLATERMRVASQVGPGETVVNMFAGVGCFSIMMARHARPAKVYSIDVNPVAVEYAKENVALNRVEGVVVPILGDAREVVGTRLRDVADRVVMQLPEGAYGFLDAAVTALKPRGGTVHYYDFVDQDELSGRRLEVLGRLEELGWRGKVLLERRVSQVAPRRYEAVFDIEVTAP